MNARHLFAALAFVVAGAGSVAIVSCQSSSAPHENVGDDAGGTSGDSGNGGDDGGAAKDGGGGDSTTPDCFTNPHTHYEIINACTDASRVDKHPTLPLLQPDGSLPPLP